MWKSWKPFIKDMHSANSGKLHQRYYYWFKLLSKLRVADWTTAQRNHQILLFCQLRATWRFQDCRHGCNPITAGYDRLVGQEPNPRVPQRRGPARRALNQLPDTGAGLGRSWTLPEERRGWAGAEPRLRGAGTQPYPSPQEGQRSRAGVEPYPSPHREAEWPGWDRGLTEQWGPALTEPSPRGSGAGLGSLRNRAAKPSPNRALTEGSGAAPSPCPRAGAVWRRCRSHDNTAAARPTLP